jgi:hypothetical protein
MSNVAIGSHDIGFNLLAVSHESREYVWQHRHRLHAGAAAYLPETVHRCAVLPRFAPAPGVRLRDDDSAPGGAIRKLATST